jgi:hypothetical protein
MVIRYSYFILGILYYSPINCPHFYPRENFPFWSIWLLLISVFGICASLNYSLIQCFFKWNDLMRTLPTQPLSFFSFSYVSKGIFSMLIVPILPLVIDEAKRIILVHLETSSYKKNWSKIKIWVYPTCFDWYCK